MSKRISCEICGLKTRRVDNVRRTFMAKFPLDEDRCRQWVQLTGKEDLVYVPIEKLHQLKYICGNHFKPKDFKKKKTQLKKNAVPSISITCKPLPNEMMIGFPLHLSKNDETNNHSLIVNELSTSRYSNIVNEQPATRFNKAILPVKRSPSPKEPFEDSSNAELPASPIINADNQTPSECTVPPAPDTEALPGPEPVCRICLRSGIAMVADMDDTLEVFYDELIYYDTYEHEVLSYCQICENQLRRLYNFRQKCKRAHILLKTMGADLFKPESLKNVQIMIPQPSIGICTAKSNQKVYLSVYTSNDLFKEEQELKQDENARSLTEYSFLIKKIGSDAFLKLEKAEEKQENNNVSETDLKSYIQDFLKYDEDSGLNDHYDLTNDDHYDLTNDDHETTTRDSKKRKRKKDKIIKPILTKSEKAMRRKTKAMELFKQWVLDVMKRGELEGVEDLGVKISEEVVLRLLDKCPLGTFVQTGLAKSIFSASKIPKMRRFLQSLLERYNPAYDDMFEVTYLHTREKQIEEFEARQHLPRYKEAVFKCDICYQVYELQGLLEFHMKWHDENKPYSCSICSMRFIGGQALKKHVAASHREKFSCKLCSFVTYKFNTMKNHYRDHKQFVYQCPDCDKKFSKYTSMKNHFRLLHRLNSICSLCGRRLLSEAKLKSHIAQKHSEISPEILASEPTEQCNNCKAAFHTKEALLYHAASAHRPTYNEDQNVSYSCFYCKIDFDTVDALYAHKRSEAHRDAIQRLMRKKVATGRRTHRTCPLCNKEVLNEHPRSLYEHYRAEHPAAPYHPEPDVQGFLCEQCGKTFTLKHLYTDHLNLHTGAQPYECSECGIRFSLRAKAHMHLRSHRRKDSIEFKKRSKRSGPLVCDICLKVFKFRFNLERHYLTHTGEKPHQCPICDQRFTQAGAIKLHVTTVHLKLPTPYKSRGRAERATKTTTPWKPRAGISVPPMSLELLQSYVIGPWKNDLPKLKAVLDANNVEVGDAFDGKEEIVEDVMYKEEVMDAQMEEMDDMFGAEEEVIEEPCDSDF